MHESICIPRAGRIGGRLRFGARVAAMLSVLLATSAGGQSLASDSAEIYERLASATASRRLSGVGGNKMKDARRAYELYAQRHDTAGQARALLLIAEEHDGSRIDSLIAVSRHAVALLRRPAADSSVLAQALGLLAYGLLNSPAPLDSAARYRAENIRLRDQYPALREKARELWAYGQAFQMRRFADSAVFGKSFVRTDERPKQRANAK